MQNPMTAFNPSLRIGRQLEKTCYLHNPQISRQELQLLVSNTLQQLGLDDLKRILKSYPDALSGGMLQRIMIAAALINQPTILVADEATTAIDACNRIELMQLLRQLCSGGMAILFVTHDLRAASMADRILIMNDGQLVEAGTTEQIFNEPKEEYTKYKSNGGELSLFDWRRDNVNNMIKSVYSAVKTINKSVTFGISPASDMDYDYSALYADVIKWSRNEGYIDYICPQIYFGFKNETQPFMQTTKLWCDNATCALYIALPMYKSGLSDEYAGESGKNEFKKEKNIVARQITYISKIDKIKGYYIFSYSSLKDNEETSNLYSAMQNSSV